MEDYVFTLESHGRRNYDTNLMDGAETIRSTSIKQAIKKFADNQKLKLETFDQLSDNSYRVFLQKKALFKQPIEYVYRVTIENQ